MRLSLLCPAGHEERKPQRFPPELPGLVLPFPEPLAKVAMPQIGKVMVALQSLHWPLAGESVLPFCLLPPYGGRSWSQLSARASAAGIEAAEQILRNLLRGKRFDRTRPLLSASDRSEAAGTRTPNLRIYESPIEVLQDAPE